MLEELLEKGLHLVTKVSKNMKNKLLLFQDKLGLMKRGKIEAVNDILMSVCDIDRTHHRNPINALVQVLARLAAYTFLYPLNSKLLAFVFHTSKSQIIRSTGILTFAPTASFIAHTILVTA